MKSKTNCTKSKQKPAGKMRLSAAASGQREVGSGVGAKIEWNELCCTLRCFFFLFFCGKGSVPGRRVLKWNVTNAGAGMDGGIGVTGGIGRELR